MMTRLGIYSLLGGLFLGIFSGISSFMQSNNFWVNLTLSKVIGEDHSETIIGLIDVAFIQDFLDAFIYEWPVFGLLLVLGAIFLIISLFLKEH